jgi:hypothetical protein
MEQIERKYLVNLYSMLSSFDIKAANIKTAYWLSKNIRILASTVKEFEALRTELTTTPVFKQFQNEISEATTDELKAVVNEKYKDVISEADKELSDFLDVKIDLPSFYKIKIDNLEGIESAYIPTLFDLIDSE